MEEKGRMEAGVWKGIMYNVMTGRMEMMRVEFGERIEGARLE